jgi:hypothetical protein
LYDRIVVRADLVALCCAFGCGRIHFGTASDATNDVANDAPIMCSAFGAWGQAELISELSTPGNDWGGNITADGLAYYYQSDSTGTNELYVARRPHRAAPFDPPVVISEINGPSSSDPSITGDELDMFMTNTTPTDCIGESTRASTSDPWGPVAVLSALCTGYLASCPFITADGLTLYYYDAMLSRILVTQRATRADAFPAGVILNNLYTGIFCPSMSGDGLSLYYEGGGPVSVYVATRPSLTGLFDPNDVSVMPIVTGIDNEDSSITADGLELFFASDRPGPGKFDIYRITRGCQ